ncbi:glucans biosynthesis protein MdoC [Rosenbergiella australiborealis]|uniref:Glucans biosynthesis protein C n=1 Tax=Rosenbergiella australiborealis TaxID=1544696 RepID=A0ABS5T2S2_9GAMM|nr:glucans biosynthesis protein MdoC [Rosenbergiella australiborealis]MBT0726652.1 glucans biosynthesis protein MdoC [Rosenbergiella australiborealis]
MSTQPQQREYFLDSIRAILMLLGVPFHISLIYSTQHWTVNSPTSSFGLTLLNEFIHSFRMEVFFVISGYFSYMLYLRYSPKRWLKVRLERVGIPFLAAIPLITVPQFFLIKNVSAKFPHWSQFTLYQKYNILCWELISHLWFLLILCLLTLIGYQLFRFLATHTERWENKQIGWTKVIGGLSSCVLIWCLLRRLLLLTFPLAMKDALMNIVVMQVLFYLPFFMLGALAWQIHSIKALFLKPHPLLWLGTIVAFSAYHLNQQYSSGDGWLYELDAIISMFMGICMLNFCFSSGFRLLNTPSPFIRYLVNASLFIYLVHHPLTLIYGLFIGPSIHNNILGFFTGLVMVFGVSFILYEIHLRIPVLRFLFSGKHDK